MVARALAVLSLQLLPAAGPRLRSGEARRRERKTQRGTSLPPTSAGLGVRIVRSLPPAQKAARRRPPPPPPRLAARGASLQPQPPQLGRPPVVRLHRLHPCLLQELPRLVGRVRKAPPDFRLPLEAAELARRRLLPHEGEEDARPEAADEGEETPYEERHRSGRQLGGALGLLEHGEGHVVVVRPIDLL